MERLTNKKNATEEPTGRTAGFWPVACRYAKLAEEAVKQAEDRIRLIINTIPTMAWSIRPDGAIDFVNQRWLDYTGLTLEEESEEPSRPIHPEDVPRVMERWLV